MSVGVEQNPYVGVPVLGDYERPPVSARFRFRELTNDRVEVHHPFHGVTVYGDTSTIEDKSMDAAAVVLFKEMPFLVDCMKLSRTRRFETRMYAGEYAQLSHCHSTPLFAVRFGGGPMDILDGLYNDAPHSAGGHGDEDNYQGHGVENLHDQGRTRFFERSGILSALVDAGALRREPSGLYVGKTMLSIDGLLREEDAEIRRSFLSNKYEDEKKRRRLDGDRFQYSEEEEWLVRCAQNRNMPDPLRIPVSMAAAAIDAVVRRIVPENGEGEQLVFKDVQSAMMFAKGYVRHNAEHWNEPVQDLVSDILNLAQRYFFLCNNPHAKNFHYFYPQEYLHTSASLLYEQYDRVAEADPVMAWFLETTEAIAADQRSKTLSNGGYTGPNPPEMVRLHKSDSPTDRKNPYFDVVDGQFVIELPMGRKRTINPRVLVNAKETVPLSKLEKEYEEFERHQHQWIGDYIATVDIEDAELAVQIQDALQMIREDWPIALQSRPFMPPSELQRTIKEANEYVRRMGAIANNSC